MAKLREPVCDGRLTNGDTADCRVFPRLKLSKTHIHRISASEELGAGRTAIQMDIVSIELDCIIEEIVHVRCGEFASTGTEIAPSETVH